MSKRTLGMLAGMVGSALGAWWWVRQRTAEYHARNHTPRERGELIFSNTPSA